MDCAIALKPLPKQRLNWSEAHIKLSGVTASWNRPFWPLAQDFWTGVCGPVILFCYGWVIVLIFR
jgi:hypothetical protein